MSLVDAFAKEDRTEVKFSQFFALVKQAAQYETLMNAVNCDVPHRFIRETKAYITAVPDYVSFKATPEQKASTAGTGYFRVRKDWKDAASQIGAFKDRENAVELAKQNAGYYVFDNDGKNNAGAIMAAALFLKGSKP